MSSRESACSTTAAARESWRSQRNGWARAGSIGTDVDPQAMEASRANAAINQVECTFVTPDALGDEPYDVIVANILTNPLRMLAPAMAAQVRTGGRIVLSGHPGRAGTVDRRGVRAVV